jgi:hypothetical protein
VLIFAVAGFVVPWLLLAFYATANRMGGHPSTTPLLYLYLWPMSIAALGLDNASLLVGLLGWLAISSSNAVLYALPGTAVALIVTLLDWAHRQVNSRNPTQR